MSVEFSSFGEVSTHLDLSHLELSDDDEANELVDGTDVSKLDQGLSDFEDTQSISTNHVDDDASPTMNKKRVKMRDSWVKS